jgi:glycosyltransferase involved in cell wall biosynthesis
MRVLQVLRVDAGLYYGGGEVQAERTREALIGHGLDVQVHDPLNRDLGDVVHFFGLFDSHWEVARYCLEKGVPYVISPIFVTPRTTARLRWRSFRQRFIDFRFPRIQARLLDGAREIYPLTGLEERNLRAFFRKLPPSHRVPNGVESRFGDGLSDTPRGKVILHAGTFDRTKNQLNLIRALKGSGATLRLIGRPHDQSYYDQCRAEADGDVEFLGSIPHDSDDLIRIYQEASVFCLPSRREILPLSAMEATVAGCRLVLGNRWGGDEVWGDNALWVAPDDVSGIRDAVMRKLSEPTDLNYARAFRQKYSWEGVAETLASRYDRVLK